VSRLAALLALTLVAVPATAAPDDDAAAARAQFDDLLSTVTDHRRIPRGPSLTARVRTFLAHDASTVRGVLRDAWSAVQRDEPRSRGMRPPVEGLVSFLFGRPLNARGPEWPDPGEIAETPGVVAIREYLRPGPRYPSTPERGTEFDVVFRNAAVRPSPKPDLAAVLAAAQAESGAAASTSNAWRIDVGMALGETCAHDDDAFAALRTRANAAPGNPVLVLAMGWSARPETVPFLTQRLTEAAALRDERNGTVQLDALRAAATALHHANEGAFWRVVGTLAPGRSDRVVEQLGPAALVRWRLGLLDTAEGAEARRDALLRLCSFDLGRADVAPPPGQDSLRFFRALLAAADSDDAGLRSAALRCAENYLQPFGRYPIQTRVWDSESARSWTGEAVGSSADEHVLLRMLVADLEAGRVSFRESEPGLFERSPRWIDTVEPARSDVAGDDPPRGDPPAPVHVSAEWTEAGLRLRLRNAGAVPFGVNPVAMKYGHGELVTKTTESGGSATSARMTRLTLGMIGFRASVPLRELVVLRPGGSTTVDIPLRPSLRGIEHVEIESNAFVIVTGDGTVPVLGEWGWTRVL
jgi:hypothetical protein